MKTFALLIANYNNATYLSEALASVNQQTKAPSEIIIVDDGSNDSSVSILKKIAGQDTRIKLHCLDRNHGVGFCKRKCVEAASGKICGFLDPDDALHPDAVKLSVEAHSSNPDVSVVYTDQVMCDASLKPTGRVMSRSLTTDQSLLESGGSLTHFVTFKRDRYLQTTGINPEFAKAVDVDMYLKLEETGGIYHLPKALYHYRTHSRGISQGLANEREAALWALTAHIDACRRRGLSLRITIKNHIERSTNVGQDSLIKRLLSQLQRKFVYIRRGKT